MCHLNRNKERIYLFLFASTVRLFHVESKKARMQIYRSAKLCNTRLVISTYIIQYYYIILYNVLYYILYYTRMHGHASLMNHYDILQYKFALQWITYYDIRRMYIGTQKPTLKNRIKCGVRVVSTENITASSARPANIISESICIDVYVYLWSASTLIDHTRQGDRSNLL